MIRIANCVLLTWALQTIGPAEVIRVPQDHASIQAAIDSSNQGDTILVAPGTYLERIRLKTGITVKSSGDDAAGKRGLLRAETTVLDGGKAVGDQPGVVMADKSVLDGLTVTNIGRFDEAVWQRHFDSQGEELDDDHGSVQVEGTVPAIQIQRVSGTVRNCIVHHNGDVGIAVMGSSPSKAPTMIHGNLVFRNLGGGIGIAEGGNAVVHDNVCQFNLRAGIGCRAANPIITNNECSQNVRAGIGCREGARPVIRGNRCFDNRRAGIGIRMTNTAPIVEDNECFENAMAGIGSRDGATPTLRNNRCHHNKMAGIGCDGSAPVIIGNECRENEMAGIGMRGAAKAFIDRNECHGNKLVAIGITQGSTATVTNNNLSRTGGAPPLVAVKDNSTARILGNKLAGGGVAGILVQGTATIRENAFQGVGDKQGNAIWVWKGSTVFVADNDFDGYGAAVNASHSAVTITGNKIRHFRRAALVVKSSTAPALIHGNEAFSPDPKATVVEAAESSDLISDNVLTAE